MKYSTIKIPEGLLNKVKETIGKDETYLNISDFIRQAIRNLLRKSTGGE